MVKEKKKTKMISSLPKIRVEKNILEFCGYGNMEILFNTMCTKQSISLVLKISIWHKYEYETFQKTFPMLFRVKESCWGVLGFLEVSGFLFKLVCLWWKKSIKWHTDFCTSLSTHVTLQQKVLKAIYLRLQWSCFKS